MIVTAVTTLLRGTVTALLATAHLVLNLRRMFGGKAKKASALTHHVRVLMIHMLKELISQDVHIDFLNIYFNITWMYFSMFIC